MAGSVSRSAPNAGHFYSNIVQPIKVDCQFVVSSTDTGGYGITSLKSNGYVQNVFMNTSATPATGSPNPIAGIAMVQFKNNFNKFLGVSCVMEPPVTGSAINIADSSVLTVGTPYQIVTVGTVPAATFTVATIADTASNSAGKYMTVSDAYGNNYVLYNVAGGLGTPPSLTGSLTGYTAVPIAYAASSTNDQVAAALEITLEGLNSGNSFSVSTTGHTCTVTSSVSNVTLVPPPNAQTSGFTVSAITFTALAADWHSVGLPTGLTPTVGQVFLATATGGALGTGTVRALTNTAIAQVEVLGVTDYSLQNSSIAQNGGAYVYLKFTNGSLATTAPTAGSIVSLSFYFDQSSVTIDGL